MVQLPQIPHPRPRCDISFEEMRALRRYTAYLWRLYRLQSQCEADDLANDTVREFCHALERLQSQGRVIEKRIPFIRKIAFRVSIRTLKAGINTSTLANNLKNDATEPADSSLGKLYQAELIEQVRLLLSDEENELIELRVFQGLEWFQICEHYRLQGKALNPATLRKRFERIKLRLANCLIQRGIDSSDL